MAFRIVARDYFQPGKKEEAMKLFAEVIAETRKEPGCISYEVHQALDDPDSTAMIETWADQAAMDAHINSEHFKRIIPQIGALTAKPSRIEVYEILI